MTTKKRAKSKRSNRKVSLSQSSLPIRTFSLPTTTTTVVSVASLLTSLCCGLLAFYTFYETRKAGFVWDDRAAIRGNQDVTSSTATLHDIWTHDFWGTPMNTELSHKSFRPLVVMTFRCNYVFSGLDATPYHLVNVVLHAITTILVYYLTIILLQAYHSTGSSSSRTKPANNMFSITTRECVGATVASILFAVHPIHVEAVAGLVSRADIMAAMFMILSVICYTKSEWHVTFISTAVTATAAATPTTLAIHAERNVLQSIIWFSLCITNVLLAALSKETGATVLGILILLELSRPSMVSNKNVFQWAFVRVHRVVILIGTGVVYFIGRSRLQGKASLRKWSMMENHLAVVNNISTTMRTLSIMNTHALYGKMMLWPKPGTLSYDHGYNSTTTSIVTRWNDHRNVITLIAYSVMIGLFMVCLLRTWKIVFFAFVWSVASIAPALNIVFWVGTVLAERLLYVPSVGYVIGIGWLVTTFIHEVLCKSNITTTKKTTTTKATTKTNKNNKKKHITTTNLSILVCLIASYCTMIYHMYIHSRERSLDWLDEPSLYETGYKTNPSSVKIMNNLAQVLLRDGNVTNAYRAERLLYSSTILLPNYPSADFNRGLAFSTIGNKSEAIRLMKVALSKNIESQANVYAYMAQEMMELQYAHQRIGRKTNVTEIHLIVQYVNKALHLGCKLPLVQFTLGNAKSELKLYNESVQAYKTSLLWNSDQYLEPGTKQSDTDILNQLALSYQGRNHTGDHLLAIETYEKCIALKPAKFEPMVNLGVLYTETNMIEKAKSIYDQALLLAPKSPVLLNNVAHLYLTADDDSGDGKYLKAYNLSSLAFQLMPDHHAIKTTYQRALVGMGDYYFKLKKFTNALSWYYKAPRIQAALPDVLEKIIKTHVQLHDINKAITHLERLIQLLPLRDDLKALLIELKEKKTMTKH